MIYEDRCLNCRKCGAPFSWSAGEQEYYAEKGLHQPKFCPSCREERRERNKGRIWGARVALTDTETRQVLCAKCQAPASLTISERLGRATCPRCSGDDREVFGLDVLTIEAWIKMHGRLVEPAT